MTVASVLIPRFSLLAAVGGRREMLTAPTALAPEPGREQAVGETSGSAEAYGIREGMPIAEALGRCPGLVLVPPDPSGATATWERVLRRLEGIGATVESRRSGEAFFEVDGLRGLWGPRREQVLAKAAKAVGAPTRVAAGPNRFCARAAAGFPRRRGRGFHVVAAGTERGFLAPLPVSLLVPALQDERDGGDGRGPDGAVRLVATLGRLGVATLGDLAGLPRIAVADRFGALGIDAHDLASGRDAPLRPRTPHEELVQAISLPEAFYGAQLERALELLIERILGDPRRRGRAIRSLRLEARLVGGGSWGARIAMRSATTSPMRLRLALAPRLEELTSPAEALALRALELAPAAGSQQVLDEDPAARRRERLAEAVRQVRAAAGRDSVLRVLEIEPGSRIPERWATLAPFNDDGSPPR